MQAEQIPKTRALWLQQTHYLRISQWTIDDCCKYLYLSENSQKKLQGIETVGQAKHAVRQRLEIHLESFKQQITLLENKVADLEKKLSLANTSTSS